MDKLQPILAQKYWIVFVAAMILPTTGWWIAAAKVQGETETATTAAKSAFGTVPDRNSPNQTYGDSVNKITETLVRNNGEHNKYLWETQRATMTWPPSIHDDMQKVTYKGDIHIDIRRVYRQKYFDQLNDIPKIVEAPSVANPSGKVVFDLSSFTPQIAESDWGTSPPDVKTMWEVQEDLWLVTALLGAVADTNRGYPNILQAPIKQIIKIELRGGTSKSSAGDTSSASSDGSTTTEGEEGMMSLGGGYGSSMKGGGGSFGQPGAGMGEQGSGGAAFDPTDVFGSDVDKGDSATGETSESTSESPPGEGDPFGAMSNGQPGQAGSNRRRYINDEEGAPFKTRGFYLQVIMDHSKLPDLMVNLASLDWPVEIVRVQQHIQNPDQFAVVSGRNQMAGGARMAGGFPGMGSGRHFGGLSGVGRGRMSTSPMESMSPMGPMGSENRSGVEQDKAAKYISMLTAAMQKTSLVEVAIAGKLTLFQPPTVDESAIAANGESTTPAADAATSVPPAGGVDTNTEANTPEEPAAPGTTPGNVPATGTPAGTPPADATPTDSTQSLPNTAEKVAPAPGATPASGASKNDAAQAE